MQSQELLGYSPMTLIAKQRFSSLFLTHTHMNPSHEVVIKLFDALLFDTPQEQQHFLDDIAQIQALNHPCILPFVSQGIDHNHPYLISPYLPNGSLRFHLNQSRFSWEKTLKLLQQIGDALTCAHTHQLVHANLKPENIFLTPLDDVLLMDFFLPSLYAKMQENGYHPDAHTSAYMAPEVFYGQRTPKSDQYALACLAFELISGSVPFHALSFITSVNKHGQKTLPSLKTFVPNVPAHIDDAIRKALDKQPDNRYESIDAFLSALAEPQKSLPTAEFIETGKGQTLSLQLLASLDRVKPFLYRKDRNRQVAGDTAFVRLLEDQDMLIPGKMMPLPAARPKLQTKSSSRQVMLTSTPQESHAPLILPTESRQLAPIAPIDVNLADLSFTKQHKKSLLWMGSALMLFLLIIPLLIFSFQMNRARVENPLYLENTTNLTIPPQRGTAVLQTPLTTLHAAQPTPTVTAAPTSPYSVQPTQAPFVPPTQAPTQPPVPTPSPASMVYVNYQLNSHWLGGFSTTLTITNNSLVTINGWTLQFTFPGDERIIQLWSGHYTQSDENVTITNVDYDAIIAPGHTVTLGFNGIWRFSYASPTTFIFNGATVN